MTAVLCAQSRDLIRSWKDSTSGSVARHSAESFQNGHPASSGLGSAGYFGSDMSDQSTSGHREGCASMSASSRTQSCTRTSFLTSLPPNACLLSRGRPCQGRGQEGCACAVPVPIHPHPSASSHCLAMRIQHMRVATVSVTRHLGSELTNSEAWAPKAKRTKLVACNVGVQQQHRGRRQLRPRQQRLHAQRSVATLRDVDRARALLAGQLAGERVILRIRTLSSGQRIVKPPVASAQHEYAPVTLHLANCG